MDNTFTLTPCKTKQSCKAKLNKPQKLNLSNLKVKFKVTSDAGIALVLDIDSMEVIVHSYGELIFKTGNKKVTEENIKHIAKRIFDTALPK